MGIVRDADRAEEGVSKLPDGSPLIFPVVLLFGNTPSPPPVKRGIVIKCTM
jgi:hypothetical protein